MLFQCFDIAYWGEGEPSQLPTPPQMATPLICYINFFWWQIRLTKKIIEPFTYLGICIFIIVIMNYYFLFNETQIEINKCTSTKYNFTLRKNILI